jgi:hypothetical protein
MVYNRTGTSRGTKLYREKHAKATQKLPDFPVGTEIAFKFCEGESLGTVIEHDKTLARLVTNKGGSYDPLEMTIFKKPV